MAADVLQFLRNKYAYEFEEAREEHGEFLLYSHFLENLNVLQRKTISPFTPREMKGLIYKLNQALVDCLIVFEEQKRRTEKKKKKKSLFSDYSIKELWFIRKTRKRLLSIKEKLEVITDDAASAAAAAASSSSPSALEIHGFNDQLQELQALLLESCEKFKAIGITCMGGSGKTALAQLVFHSELIRKKFSPMIWVTLSENDLNLDVLDVRARIVNNMLVQLCDAKDIDSCSLDNLLFQLREQLLGKRFLIVLDGVWHINDWYSNLMGSTEGEINDSTSTSLLSHGFPKENGGAIIVTSRLDQVASSMVGGEHNLYRIPPLSDGESIWSIFVDTVGKTGLISLLDHPTLLRMKDEIVDNCHGLPLAAKTLAEVISRQIHNMELQPPIRILKTVFKLDLHDEKDVRKAMKEVGAFSGKKSLSLFCFCLGKNARNEESDCVIDSISMDMKDKKLTVVGMIDPVSVVKKLRKFWYTELVSVGPNKKEIKERGAKERRTQ